MIINRKIAKRLKITSIIISAIVGISALIFIIIGNGFGDKEELNLMNQGEPIIFAHRGLANYYVENSASSFLNSIGSGFNAIETDVQSTKDHKLIIFHDEFGDSLLGINKPINELNWDEIENLPLKIDGENSYNKIIPLELFLKHRNPIGLVYLDIKDNSKIAADSLIYLLNKYPNYKTTLIADENIFYLNYLKSKNSNIITALEGFNSGVEWIYYVIPRKFKPDYYSSFLNKINSKHIEFLKRNDLMRNRIVYGVDSTNLHKVFEYGLQNIILDYDFSMGTIYDLKNRIKEAAYK